MPNAKTKDTTRAGRPTPWMLRPSRVRQNFGAERARRLAPAPGPIASVPEAQFARLVQVLGRDEPRRRAKSA